MNVNSLIGGIRYCVLGLVARRVVECSSGSAPLLQCMHRTPHGHSNCRKYLQHASAAYDKSRYTRGKYITFPRIVLEILPTINVLRLKTSCLWRMRCGVFEWIRPTLQWVHPTFDGSISTTRTPENTYNAHEQRIININSPAVNTQYLHESKSWN